MPKEITPGATNQSVTMHLVDSTTGLAKTGLEFDSAGAGSGFFRIGAVASTITLATLSSITAAHSDGGFQRSQHSYHLYQKHDYFLQLSNHLYQRLFRV